jgi:hypothetical protein
MSTPKDPCVCSSCWQWRGTLLLHCGCLSGYPQLPQHLHTDLAFCDEMCRGARWFSWRTVWMYSFCYNSQIECFGRTDMDIFFLFWYVELVPEVVPSLSVTPSIYVSFLCFQCRPQSSTCKWTQFRFDMTCAAACGSAHLLWICISHCYPPVLRGSRPLQHWCIWMSSLKPSCLEYDICYVLCIE